METLKRSILLLIFLTSGILISCQKELNFEPVSSVAVFTFDATNGNCNNVMLNGFYLTGFPMTVTNTITINVNVTSPGTFTLNTSSVNGISFSGSGTLVNTGAQTISLTATGTPTAAGGFEFEFLEVTNGCNFEILFTDPGDASFTFLGNGGVCTDYTIAGDYWITVMFNTSHSITLNVDVTIPGAYNISTVANGITFSGTGNLTATGNQTVTLFPSGAMADYIYTTYSVSNGTSGCTFDIDYEPAEFSLITNGTNCIDPVFSGKYNAGVPLTDANTITVNINVIKTGPYSIWSSTSNGFSFEKIGTFTSTGPQTVVLTGIGTPVLAGTIELEIGNHMQQFCKISLTVN